MQAMMTTGAQAVAASLWSVPDISTRRLFELFYARVAQGDAPAHALRQAQATSGHRRLAPPVSLGRLQVYGLALQGTRMRLCRKACWPGSGAMADRAARRAARRISR